MSLGGVKYQQSCQAASLEVDALLTATKEARSCILLNLLQFCGRTRLKTVNAKEHLVLRLC